MTGANFLGACEILTGEQMPQRQPNDPCVIHEDPKLIEQRRLDAEAEAQRREQEGRKLGQPPLDDDEVGTQTNTTARARSR